MADEKKELKTQLSKDGYDMPYTSDRLVFDDKGENLRTKLDRKIETQPDGLGDIDGLDFGEELKTENKSLVGAINELAEKIDNSASALSEIKASSSEITASISSVNDATKNIEAIKKHDEYQDLMLERLYSENDDERIEITKEANSIELPFSKEGAVEITSIKGNSNVNRIVNPTEELVLNKPINITQSGTIEIEDTVDGGNVDIHVIGKTDINCLKADNWSFKFILGSKNKYVYDNSKNTAYIPANTTCTLFNEQEYTLNFVVGMVNQKDTVREFSSNDRITKLNLGDGEFIKYIEYYVGSNTGEDSSIMANLKQIVVCAEDVSVKPKYHDGLKGVDKIKVTSKSEDGSKSVSIEYTFDEPMYSLPDGVVDEVVFFSDCGWAIKKNCGCLTLTDKSNIIDADNSLANTIKVAIAVENIKEGAVGFCDKNYPMISSDIDSSDYQCSQVNGGKLYVRFDRDVLETIDVAGVSKHLKDEPITFIYPLETPYYISLKENPELPTCGDKTIIEVVQDIDCKVRVENTGFKAMCAPGRTYTLNVEGEGITGAYVCGVDASVVDGRCVVTTTSDYLNEVKIYGSGIVTNPTLFVGDVDIKANFEGIRSAYDDEYDSNKGQYRLNIISDNDIDKNSFEVFIQEPLRSLPSGVRDEAVAKDGNLYIKRNCVAQVLNGEEKWAISGKAFATSLPILGDTSLSDTFEGAINVLSSIPVFRESSLYNGTYEELCCGIKFTSSKTTFRMSMFSNTTTVDSLVKFLKDYPVTIIYKADEPIYELILEGSDKIVLDGYKNGKVRFTTTTIPSANTVKYSCSLPSIYTVNGNIEQLQECSTEQDMMALETAYRLTMLEILTGIDEM